MERRRRRRGNRVRTEGSRDLLWPVEGDTQMRLEEEEKGIQRKTSFVRGQRVKGEMCF